MFRSVAPDEWDVIRGELGMHRRTITDGVAGAAGAALRCEELGAAPQWADRRGP